MVRSMLSNSSLPISLWMHALKIVMYLLNRVPSKAIQKTPFGLWTGKKPSLRHLHVRGCQMEIIIYIIHWKRNWIQEQLMDISLVIQENQKGICFTILPIVQELLKLEMIGSLRMVKLVGVKLHKMWRLWKLEYKCL